MGGERESRCHCALQYLAPGDLVDAHRDVQGCDVLGARRMGCTRWQVQANAWLHQYGAGLAVFVDLPLLGPVGLEHEDIMGVAVLGEPLSTRRRQVGVRLAWVSEARVRDFESTRSTVASSGADLAARALRR